MNKEDGTKMNINQTLVEEGHEGEYSAALAKEAHGIKNIWILDTIRPLVISAVAAYYSIIGLVAIFAAAILSHYYYGCGT